MSKESLEAFVVRMCEFVKNHDIVVITAKAPMPGVPSDHWESVDYEFVRTPTPEAEKGPATVQVAKERPNLKESQYFQAGDAWADML